MNSNVKNNYDKFMNLVAEMSITAPTPELAQLAVSMYVELDKMTTDRDHADYLNDLFER